MNEKEETIYQSFINSEGSSIQYEHQMEQQCQQCVQLQKYVYQLEQEISDLNHILQSQVNLGVYTELKSQRLTKIKKNVLFVKNNGMSKSLHEETLFKKVMFSSSGHQKRKIFDDIEERTSTKALQFYKM